jgi:DNA processing protein
MDAIVPSRLDLFLQQINPGVTQQARVVLTAEECRGSNKLLADGAGVLWDIPELVDAYASGTLTGGRSPAEPLVPAELPETEAAVLSGVGFEPAEVDAVGGRSGVDMHEVLPALTMLELKGYVMRNVGGAFVRRAVP